MCLFSSSLYQFANTVNLNKCHSWLKSYNSFEKLAISSIQSAAETKFLGKEEIPCSQISKICFKKRNTPMHSWEHPTFQHSHFNLNKVWWLKGHIWRPASTGDELWMCVDEQHGPNIVGQMHILTHIIDFSTQTPVYLASNHLAQETRCQILLSSQAVGKPLPS